ncbi:MAG: hypothetical protein ICV83_27575 [Cytophagales bacterium]|nr:hypothetical protein [Cytophagales bacterium]
MLQLTRITSCIKGMLLALVVVMLTSFTTSDATKNEAKITASTPLPTALQFKPAGTLIIEGPSVVSCGQSVTFTIKGCYCNVCILWYYKGTYTATNNGSFTVAADGSFSSVTAIDHYNCSPSGTVVNYGTKQFNYSTACP